MRKITGWVVLLALVMGGALTASAQESRFSLDGRYLIGSYQQDWGLYRWNGKLNGLQFGVGAKIAGPVGMQLKFESLNASDFTVNSLPISDGKASQITVDLLGDYNIPFEKWQLRPFGGYSLTADTFTVGSTEYFDIFSGLVIGARGDTQLTELVSLSGSLGVMPSLNLEEYKNRDSSLVSKGGASGFQYGVAANYAVNRNFSVEVGYASRFYTYRFDGDPTKYKTSISGVFGDVRLSF